MSKLLPSQEIFMRRPFLFLSAAMLLLSSPALAAGKVGLWTVTSTYQFGMRYVPPALVSLARAQGLKPPVSGQPFSHHMCMVKYEADGRDPLHLNGYDVDCTNRIISSRAGRTVMESVCYGPLEGVGRYDIQWRGNDHFDGSYQFKGRFRGDATRMSSSFSADWQGDSCRDVRPYVAQSFPN